MPHLISFLDNSVQLAHYEMVKTIRDLAVGNGWVVLRYDTTQVNHELILKGEGLAGTDEIFVGFRTYHDIGADYYNIVAACFIGYLPLETFDNQPGAILKGVPCHNQRVDFWLTLNAQRIALAMKVGTPVYEHCYVGKFLPYAPPSQYPYPVCCGGMFVGVPAKRFSDTAQKMPVKETDNLQCRFVDGTWKKVIAWPWNSGINVRDTEGDYPVIPAVLESDVGDLGELDGIGYICGFDNTVENTLTISGNTWVVMQDVYRTSFNDYYAMRMDT